MEWGVNWEGILRKCEKIMNIDAKTGGVQDLYQRKIEYLFSQYRSWEAGARHPKSEYDSTVCIHDGKGSLNHRNLRSQLTTSHSIYSSPRDPRFTSLVPAEMP